MPAHIGCSGSATSAPPLGSYHHLSAPSTPRQIPRSPRGGYQPQEEPFPSTRLLRWLLWLSCWSNTIPTIKPKLKVCTKLFLVCFRSLSVSHKDIFPCLWGFDRHGRNSRRQSQCAGRRLPYICKKIWKILVVKMQTHLRVCSLFILLVNKHPDLV